MNETQISAEIREMLKKEFGDIMEFTRHQCGLAKGFSGTFIRLGEKYWFDYIGFTRDGRFIGIEVKMPKGKTDKTRREGQDKLREKLCSWGGYGIKTTGVEDCRKKMLEIKALILKNCGNVV